ncbi:hypothetical protein LCGC14_1727440, partial [marine sediment metagenome]
EGQLPFGTRPGEQAIVELIVGMYRKPRGRPRLTYGKIAKKLNATVLKPRRAAQWTSHLVRNVILRQKGKA